MVKNIIGFSGAFLFLFAYFLNSINYINSNDLIYHFLNLFGAIFLGWRVYQDKNYSNFILEIFFIIIAVYHIIRLLLC